MQLLGIGKFTYTVAGGSAAPTGDPISCREPRPWRCRDVDTQAEVSRFRRPRRPYWSPSWYSVLMWPQVASFTATVTSAGREQTIM